MKALLLHLVLGFYLLTLTGVRINAHWCGNELTDLDWFCQEGDRHCACPGNEPAGCCRNVTCNLSFSGHQLAEKVQMAVARQAASTAVAPRLACLNWHNPTAIGYRQEISRHTALLARAWQDDGDQQLYLRKHCLRT